MPVSQVFEDRGFAGAPVLGVFRDEFVDEILAADGVAMSRSERFKPIHTDLLETVHIIGHVAIRRRNDGR